MPIENQTGLGINVFHSIDHSFYQLQSSFIQLQHSAGYSNNPDLAAAEMRKSELQATKASLDRKLASNYNTRAQLQKQLKSLLLSQKRMEENLER